MNKNLTEITDLTRPEYLDLLESSARLKSQLKKRPRLDCRAPPAAVEVEDLEVERLFRPLDVHVVLRDAGQHRLERLEIEPGSSGFGILAILRENAEEASRLPLRFGDAGVPVRAAALHHPARLPAGSEIPSA